MVLSFDLTDDERQIFMAETEEQIDILTNGLVVMEKEPDNEELIQNLFRAAHTMKGSSGMIGHTRMVGLTHELETALDSIRKQELGVSPELIDVFLDSVDAIKELSYEIVDGQERTIPYDEIVGRFTSFVSGEAATDQLEELSVSQMEEQLDEEEGLLVIAEIADDSIASAARAMQVALALQNVGEIISMNPSMDYLEQAKKISQFGVKLYTDASAEQVFEIIKNISEIDRVVIGNQAYQIKSDQPKKAVGEAVSKIEVWIVKDCPTPAVRALQLSMTLEDIGSIISMSPTKEEIESLLPVELFTAEITSSRTVNEIYQEIDRIMDLDKIFINGNEMSSPDAVDQMENLDVISSAVEDAFHEIENLLAAEQEEKSMSVDNVIEKLMKSTASDEPVLSARVVPLPAQPPAPMSSPRRVDSEEITEPPKLGEMLVNKGKISQEQLDQTVKEQEESPEKPLIGKMLVDKQLVHQEDVDQNITEQISEMRSTIQKASKAIVEQPRPKMAETVRTSVERLDNLMNLVGELITDRNRLLQIRGELETEMRGNPRLELLSGAVGHVGRITDQLQEEVMSIRMLPVSNVFDKMPRLVRDLSRVSNKKIDLEIEGKETELDRSVIERIGDPIIHLLRNCVDHGIEAEEERLKAGKPAIGKISLTARHESGQIFIQVMDDGGGIDPEKIKKSAVKKGILSEKEAAALSETEAIDLIFQSGLSTSATVSEISGRGVGMDIVRNNIESLNGSVTVDTEVGKGTEFQIILPLTLAIVPILLVDVADRKFAIPLMAVNRSLRIPKSQIKTIRGEPSTVLQGQVLPIVHLDTLLGFRDTPPDLSYMHVVAVRAGRSQIGFAVDRFIGEEEVMLKSLGFLANKVPGVSGAAILGDGNIALILEITSLLKLIRNE